MDICAHAAQFVDVAESRFKDRLANPRLPVRPAHQGGERRVEVSGKTRIGSGVHVHPMMDAAGAHPHSVGTPLHHRARFLQLGQQRADVLGDHLFNQHVASGRRGRQQVRAGLQAIGNNRIGRAVQVADPLDRDVVRAGALDARAHQVQKHGRVDHLRLTRGVVQDGRAAGRARGEHQVDRRAHAAPRHEKRGPHQLPRRGLHVAVLSLHHRPQRGKPAKVKIHRP